MFVVDGVAGALMLALSVALHAIYWYLHCSLDDGAAHQLAGVIVVAQSVALLMQLAGVVMLA